MSLWNLVFHRRAFAEGTHGRNGDVLPDTYTGMRETDTDDVNVRTELNVENSDATLIFSHGVLFGGSAYTECMVRKHGKPCLHIDFDKQDTFAIRGR